ncbi:NAD kinase [Galactobacter valiniphilus]|uniref:NAD kinase n=1 Tax=Galactobacter valiniphilus TaxID=2676122 RepID=A0A399JC57_9MICC|nr:NAD kinase [Galactobacter valiniphilus]RII42824.1 NAD kinase [Galactobacter valiniphilus]
MRRILVLTHTGRDEAVNAALEAGRYLRRAGLAPVMRADEAAQIRAGASGDQLDVEILGQDVQLSDIELGMVLGGDGTILRSAELVRAAGVPLLGVNLGHVGFLAESDRADLSATVDAIVERSYTVEERLTMDVQVWHNGRRTARTWALNEAAVEKADRERMVEVVVEVDARPISTFGCDGVVMATPTGSTAYAFSAGGPVVWPEVEALVMAPISAHALFARPLVVAPTSTMAVELITRTDARGVLWCDGRRMVDLPPGSRVEATRSEHPVRLARLTTTPFSERLVRKFQLPIMGWRGPVEPAAPLTTEIPVVGNVTPVEPPRNNEPFLPQPGERG